MPAKTQKFIGIYFCLSITLILWLLSMGGWFELPSGLLYDSLVRLTPASSTPNQNILLIKCQQEDIHAPQAVWEEVMGILQAAKVNQVAFSFMPDQVARSFYQQSLALKNIIFARQFNSQAKTWFEALPPLAVNLELNFAVQTRPHSSYGVYRKHFAQIKLENKIMPSLVLATASKALQKNIKIANPFMLNFLDRPSVLPTISLQRLLQKKISPKVLTGRCILIGLAPQPRFPGLASPLSKEGNMLSMLQFNGYALENILQQKTISTLPDWAIALCIFFAAGISLVLYQLLPVFMVISSAIIFFIITLCMSWISPYILHTWIPATEILTAQIIIIVLVFIRRSRKDEMLVRELILNKSMRMRKSILPQSVFDGSEYWNKIVNMINQTLSLERTIFLETVEGDHRVKEVVALNCSIDDIDERRRDFERTPYTSALEQRGLYQLEKKYLSQGDSDNIQYLVPLRFADQILGFWALEIKEKTIKYSPEILESIPTFASEIAEVLFRRKLHLQNKKEENSLRLKLLGMSSGIASLEKVYQSMNILEKRLMMLEAVFETLGTATVLYDLFGQVIQLNQRMATLLQQSNLAPYSLSALDLAVELTGKDAGQVRALLREIISSHQAKTMTINIEKLGNTPMFFIIRALGKSRQQEEEGAFPFELYGILFELIDITEVRELGDIKEHLIEEVSSYLRSGVQILGDSCSLIEEEEQGKNAYTEKVISQRDELINLLDHLDNYMRHDTLDNKHNIFPLSVPKKIENVIKEIKDQLEEKKIAINYDIQDKFLVMAEQAKLKDIFRDILLILIDDGTSNSQINISCIENEGYLDVIFDNQGFGLPKEDFERLLYQNLGTPSKLFKNLQRDIVQVRKWDGELWGHSELGQGIVFRLHLKKFWQSNHV